MRALFCAAGSLCKNNERQRFPAFLHQDVRCGDNKNSVVAAGLQND